MPDPSPKSELSAGAKELGSRIERGHNAIQSPNFPERKIAPEYEQKKLTLFFDWEVFNAIGFKFSQPQAWDHLDTSLEIIKSLPPGIKVTGLMTDSSAKEVIEGKLSEEDFKKIVFHRIPGRIGANRWEQDLSEGDSTTQFVPLNHDTFSSNLSNDPVIELLRRRGRAFVQAPIDFQGGNICVARNKSGESIVFVGAESFNITERLYAAAGKEISEQQFKDIIQKMYRSDDVRIVGVRGPDGKFLNQSETFFHLDRAFMPIKDGLVASTKLVDGVFTDHSKMKQILIEFGEEKEKFEKKHGKILNDWNALKGEVYLKGDYPPTAETIRAITPSFMSSEREKDLEKLRKIVSPLKDLKFRNEQLAPSEAEALGKALHDFDIVPIKIKMHTMLEDRVFTNFISFHDPRIDKTTVLVPDFNAVQKDSWFSKADVVDPKLFEENISALKKHGIEVRKVKDSLSSGKGGLHCNTNRY